MLLSKYDINNVYKLSENIADAEINPYIQDAETFDIQPLLPAAMYAAIVSQLPVPQIAWDKNTTYAANNIVFHIDRFYKCVTGNTASEPTTANANWASAELLNFWLQYVKPYYIYCALHRFILEHGANITQYGFRQNNEDTSNEISDSRRAAIRNNIQSKANHYLTLFNNQFKTVSGVFDGVTYAFDSCTTQGAKPKFGFFQQGGDRRLMPNNYNDLNGCPNEYTG